MGVGGLLTFAELLHPGFVGSAGTLTFLGFAAAEIARLSTGLITGLITGWIASLLLSLLELGAALGGESVDVGGAVSSELAGFFGIFFLGFIDLLFEERADGPAEGAEEDDDEDEDVEPVLSHVVILVVSIAG